MIHYTFKLTTVDGNKHELSVEAPCFLEAREALAVWAEHNQTAILIVYGMVREPSTMNREQVA